jgi:inositol phosphorylceramide mannosyltransferase catalytic subunit
MAPKIPRRIIQTGKSRSLPLLAQSAAANLRLLNPDFEYLFFDDADVEAFIDAEFPQYRPLIDSFTARIQRYDLFRYLAVYHLGGFYFDTDVFLASGLDDLLEFGCVFPFEQLSFHSFLWKEYGMDWEIGNYGFGAAAGHPFLKAIIENCVRAQQHPEWVEAVTKSVPRIFRAEYSVLNSTGPGLISRTLAEYPEARDRVKVLFPEDVCDQRGWHCFGSYGVHLEAGSWRKRRLFVDRVLRRLWESAVWESLLKASRKRGPKRSMEFRSLSLSSFDGSTVPPGGRTCPRPVR